MSFDNTDTNPRVRELQKREQKQKLYAEVREAYEEYFKIPVGLLQSKWARVLAARAALNAANLPPYRVDQWNEDNS